MYTDVINIALAFLEGFALIISPCILPILPIILSGSLAGNKSRPIGIVIGFILSFTVVTLFSRALIQSLGISPEILRNVSFILLLCLGLIMLSTKLSEKFNLLTQRLVNVGNSIQSVNNPESGFWGGLLFGTLIGIIWTPCAGPILAAVIVQVVTQMTTFSSSLTVLAFAIGAGIPMLLIALIGRKMMTKFTVFKNHANAFRKILGAIIILTVIYLFYSETMTVTSLEATTTSSSAPATALEKGLAFPYTAPKISGITAWINTSPLELEALKGKVVLIDFWTYSCINCIRTLPYIKGWYDKYHDKGLVIIGVHSPEFEFEHNIANIEKAVKNFGIKYPVAIDNDFVTWRNFSNSFWPAHYLIDKNGQVVYEHFGEGAYATTENNIRYLLGLKAAADVKETPLALSSSQTPETYLGYARASNYIGPQALARDETLVYQYPTSFPQDQWALKGSWKVGAEKVTAEAAGAALRLHFKAGKVYAVMGVVAQPVNVKIFHNDKPVTTIKVDSHQLYTILRFSKQEEGTVELIASEPGLEVYTFTFGD